MTIETFEKARTLMIDIDKLKDKIENIMEYKRWMEEQKYKFYTLSLAGHYIDDIPRELAESVMDEQIKILKTRLSELEDEFESL